MDVAVDCLLLGLFCTAWRMACLSHALEACLKGRVASLFFATGAVYGILFAWYLFA